MDDILSFVRAWDIHPVSCTQIKRGLHHHVYLIKAREGKFVLTFYDDCRLLVEADQVSVRLRKHGIPTIEFVRTKRGKLYSRVGRQYAALTIFIEGEHPRKPLRQKLVYDIGRVTGMMDAALLDYKPRRITREVDSIPRRLAIMHTQDPVLYKTLAQVYARVKNGLRLRMCRRSFIHQDLNEVNILAKGDTVKGILDFGDAGVNYLVYDPAIAMAHLCCKHGRVIPRLINPFMRGYGEHIHLTPAERKSLYWAIIRRSIAITTYFWMADHRKQDHLGPKRMNQEMVQWGLRSIDSWMALGPEKFAQLLEGS